MRHRLPVLALTGAAALTLVLGATGAASAAARPANTRPASVTFNQCTAGGGTWQLEEPEGIMCVGGTYNGQWIAGGPLG